MNEKILIVDDDLDLLTVMRLGLTRSGYHVMTASGGTEGIQLLRENCLDLVLLDVMMSDMDGWETCQQIRAISCVPIIFVSAHNSEQARVRGLSLGGDDYIGKPFHLAELDARIKATLQRSQISLPHKEPILCFEDGELVIDTTKRLVLVRGEQVGMTPTEYRLLLYLAERQGHVLTVEEIYESLGDIKTTRMSTSVNWYIWQLRGKIEHDPAHPRFIATEPGLGYRFAANGNHREAKLLFKP